MKKLLFLSLEAHQFCGILIPADTKFVCLEDFPKQPNLLFNRFLKKINDDEEIPKGCLDISNIQIDPAEYKAPEGVIMKQLSLLEDKHFDAEGKPILKEVRNLLIKLGFNENCIDKETLLKCWEFYESMKYSKKK